MRMFLKQFTMFNMKCLFLIKVEYVKTKQGESHLQIIIFYVCSLFIKGVAKVFYLAHKKAQ